MNLNHFLSQNDNFNTAYDDVFRTLMNDCRHLMIPMINEIFGESYTGDEEIVFYPNEIYIRQQDGETKRITDSSFGIRTKYGEKKYLLECQSNPDSKMLIRVYEYSVQLALREQELTNDRLKVSIPHCAVLFLRHTKSTPDKMTVEIETPKGSVEFDVEFDVEVMKAQQYTLEEIFEKKLLFLLPYYIFTYESQFKEYNTNKKKLSSLQAEYHRILVILEDMVKRQEIDAYTKHTLTEMTNRVVEKIARKYQNVVKGVKNVMGGQILEYEAKTIKNQGRTEGLSEGIELGMIKGRTEGLSEGIELGETKGRMAEKIHLAKAFLDVLDDETIAQKTGLPLEQVKALRASQK